MGPSLTQIERIVRRYSGTRRVGSTSRIYHDLSIAGDDAWELLEQLTQEFGTSFDGFPFVDYFPEETEALPAYWGRFFGLRGRWRPLTLGHLVEVARRGAWFEPNSLVG